MQFSSPLGREVHTAQYVPWPLRAYSISGPKQRPLKREWEEKERRGAYFVQRPKLLGKPQSVKGIFNNIHAQYI